MSDETTAPESTEAPETEQQGDPAEETLGEGGKKALDSERTARKEAERKAGDLQRRLDMIEMEKLSDLEKAQKSAKTAEDRAATLEVEVQRLRLATKHGLTEDEAADLPDDLEKAERIAARLAEHKSGNPLPDPTQGGMGGKSKSAGDQFADFANTFFTR